MPNLNETLFLIAAQIKADPAELINYASFDEIGGYHPDPTLRKWDMGSMWEVEGQMLYALVRHLKPELIVEIGGWVGCSASHLASAVRDNGVGQVISVDNVSEGREHGEMFPDELKQFVTFVRADGRDWLASQADNSIGLVFEDASHDTSLVAELSRLALEKLVPGGYLVNHDAAHDFAIVGGGVQIPSPVGRQVRDGLASANAYFRVYRAEPSDCGIAVTVKPKGVTTLGNAHIESVSPPPVAYEESVDFSEVPQLLNAARGEDNTKEAPTPKKKRAAKAK